MGNIINCFRNKKELETNLMNRSVLDNYKYCHQCQESFTCNEYNKHIVTCKHGDL